MRYHPIDSNFFASNRKRFTTELMPKSIAIFHSNEQYPRNGDQYLPFRQQSDLFYLSGIEQEKTILVLAPEASEKQQREILFILKSDEELEQWEGHKLTVAEAQTISGIATVKYTDDFETVLRQLLVESRHIYLNYNEYPKFFTEVKDRNQRLGEELLSRYPLHSYERSAPILASLRLIKSETEIELLQKACNITEKAFKRVLKTVKPGIAEFEVQAEIDHEFTISRANGHGYQPIIASGANACALHYVTNNEICEDGDLLLFDFGAEYANYTADMSRTIPVTGKFSARQRACYEAVLKVQRELIKLYVPGSTIGKINDQANKLMEEEMIGLGLFSREQVENQKSDSPLYKRYFMHGTAHFLGLDVHDVGLKETILKPGMVLTCEPGIYIKEENIGIRLENDILVTENTPVDLMAHTPIEPDEIEALMDRESSFVDRESSFGARGVSR